MNETTADFLDRIFHRNKTPWWSNISAETPKKKYGSNARFLQTELTEELSDTHCYRDAGKRALYFFSSSPRSSIDGRYGDVGVEEKYNPLDLKEHLIDGAIHRGIVWEMGNPQNIQGVREAISLYVVNRDRPPMTSITVDLYIPILVSLHKIGVTVVFIDERSGEYWHVRNQAEQQDLPKWLAVKPEPTKWDLGLEKISQANQTALEHLGALRNKTPLHANNCLPEMGNKGEFQEIKLEGGIKAAIIDYGNEWRLLELGLLLRSFGYDAVKVIYNSQKHKNTGSRGKALKLGGRGVEKRVAHEMLNRYAVILDWGVPL